MLCLQTRRNRGLTAATRNRVKVSTTTRVRLGTHTYGNKLTFVSCQSRSLHGQRRDLGDTGTFRSRSSSCSLKEMRTGPRAISSSSSKVEPGNLLSERDACWQMTATRSQISVRLKVRSQGRVVLFQMIEREALLTVFVSLFLLVVV
jgi:hypothetical protein